MFPMLPRTFGPLYDHYPCYLQPKLNGVRALYQCGAFQAEDEKIWKPGFMQHLIDAFTPYRRSLGNIILDGELYVHGWSKERISAAVAVGLLHPTADTLDIQYHVFDVVNAERKFSERWFEFYPLLQFWDHSQIRAVPTTQIWFPGEIEQQFQHWTTFGYEGVILRPDGLYEFSKKKSGDGRPRYRSKFLWEYSHQLKQT